jgi:hypothetical protein
MAVLSDQQSQCLEGWLGLWETVNDYSWPLQDTVVLHVRNRAGDHIVKASETSHHIAREITAYEEFLTRITGPIPLLEHSDLSAGILVTTRVITLSKPARPAITSLAR